MEPSNIITILISIFSSSIVTMCLSSFVLEPRSEKRKYTFEQKQTLYTSVIMYAQIALYPKEAKYAIKTDSHTSQKISDTESIENALNFIHMAIPKLQLISNSKNLITYVSNFIEENMVASRIMCKWKIHSSI